MRELKPSAWIDCHLRSKCLALLLDKSLLIRFFLWHCPICMTCLPPFGQFDVGVLRKVWNAVRNDEAAPVEGWKWESSRLRWVCWSGLCFPEEALADRFIYTETVHGPSLERILPQIQVRHQALCKENRGGSLNWVSRKLVTRYS